MKNMLRALVRHLQDNKERIVRSKDFMIHAYDETYGGGMRVENVEYVDFDSLLQSIDEFSETFN